MCAGKCDSDRENVDCSRTYWTGAQTSGLGTPIGNVARTSRNGAAGVQLSSVYWWGLMHPQTMAF